jgi:FkbM family methyltransferase
MSANGNGPEYDEGSQQASSHARRPRRDRAWHRPPWKLRLRNVISTALGSKIALPFASAFARAGLLGLGVGLHYTFERSGEAWLHKRLFRALRSPVCLDVGANVGDFTLKARASGASCVVAFEPVPETFRLLEAAVRKDQRVRPICSAAGEIEGTISFFVPLHFESSTCASRDINITDVDPKESREIVVPITTIDNFCKSEGIYFDVIKIDVEGYELEVIKGLQEMLKVAPPALIQFEFNSHHAHRHQTLNDFENLLDGYYMYRLAASSLRPLDTSDYLSTIYTFQNIVCIHSSSDILIKALS